VQKYKNCSNVKLLIFYIVLAVKYYLACKINFMKKLMLIGCMCVVFAACKKTETTEKAPRTIEKVAWLSGNWGVTTAEGSLTENWVKVNDSVYHGESYFVTPKNDTVFAETVVLDEVDGKMAYTVSVTGQNDEKPVRFDLTKITDTEITFEAPKHDYPNKIVYTQVKPDSLVAIIYGKQKGEDKSETFAMKKIK
jgi:hypothetical protein